MLGYFENYGKLIKFITLVILKYLKRETICCNLLSARVKSIVLVRNNYKKNFVIYLFEEEN